jgi:hypothetical protein
MNASVQIPREPRAATAMTCEVLSERGRVVAHLRNLSAGGCRIDCSRAVDLPKLLVVTVSHPGRPFTLDLPVEVRWRGKGATPELAALGCRFIHSPRSRRDAEILYSELAAPPAPASRSGDSTDRLPPVSLP